MIGLSRRQIVGKGRRSGIKGSVGPEHWQAGSRNTPMPHCSWTNHDPGALKIEGPSLWLLNEWQKFRGALQPARLSESSSDYHFHPLVPVRQHTLHPVTSLPTGCTIANTVKTGASKNRSRPENESPSRRLTRVHMPAARCRYV